MALVACASPARAQDAATLKKDMVGQWELSTTERSKTCVVTLKSDAAPQGLKLELEPGCAAALPFTKDIAAWSIKGLDIVRLQDAAGQPVIDFTEVESGIFEGLRTGRGHLHPAESRRRALAGQIDGPDDRRLGDGSRQRPADLRPDPDQHRGDGQDNFQVFLKPKCDPAVAAFAPTQWRLEHGQMLLMSTSGETWRFEADDNAQWRRVPDSADPLIMLRQ